MTAVGPVTDGPVTVAPLIAASGQIEAAAMQLQMQLQMAQPDFAMLSAQAPALAMSAQALQAPAYALTGLSDLAGLYGLAGLATLADLGDIGDAAELELVWPQDDVSTQADVADSVYRIARQALNDHQYNRAASLFRTLRDRYPRSTYVGNSYYWQAFALYRLGSDSALDAGRDALHMQSIRYPKATTRRDAEVLMRRIQGALARSGDADAAAALTAEAESLAPEAPTVAAAPSVGPTPPIPAIAPAPRGRYHLHDDACDDEDDIRIAALNAVLQMDADRAVPLLKTVLARRDAGSVCLRRKAVFLVSQKHTDETSRILLDVVRSDPDQEVREQGVFWLSQVPGDETVAALDSILQDPKSDPQIQEKAIFA
ncbi:MAG TPA: hypothetical protein VGU74_16915, partial [Gemmatimonadales bacterium]|nr:hypothetical protein [Gemmatimonadales bacterium]